MVVIYFDGGVDWAVLDTGLPSEDGEAPVIIWRPGVSTLGDSAPHLATDFGAFFFDIARSALEEQPGGVHDATSAVAGYCSASRTVILVAIAICLGSGLVLEVDDRQG